MKTRMILVALLLAGAAGCSQEAPPASSPDPAGGAAPVAAGAAAIQGQQEGGDGMFSLTPGSFRACDAKNGAITATAKWDVAAQGVSEVSIYVTGTKGQRKLWLDGGAAGESTTGPWVFPGSKFELVERGTEKALAEFTVEATPCAQ